MNNWATGAPGARAEVNEGLRGSGAQQMFRTRGVAGRSEARRPGDRGAAPALREDAARLSGNGQTVSAPRR